MVPAQVLEGSLDAARDAAARRRDALLAADAARAAARAAMAQAVAAKAAAHDATRDLAVATVRAQRAGWSTRRLAQHLDLSHQRVHQLTAQGAEAQ